MTTSTIASSATTSVDLTPFVPNAKGQAGMFTRVYTHTNPNQNVPPTDGSSQSPAYHTAAAVNPQPNGQNGNQRLLYAGHLNPHNLPYGYFPLPYVVTSNKNGMIVCPAPTTSGGLPPRVPKKQNEHTPCAHYRSYHHGPLDPYDPPISTLLNARREAVIKDKVPKPSDKWLSEMRIKVQACITTALSIIPKELGSLKKQINHFEADVANPNRGFNLTRLYNEHNTLVTLNDRLRQNLRNINKEISQQNKG